MNKLAAVLALLVLAIPAKTNAQTLPLLSVPTDTYITAQPGQNAVAQIGLQNTTKKPLQVRVTSSDFTPSTQTDTPPALSKPNTKYGLYNWLTDRNLQKTINVPGSQTVQYKATFRVPQYAANRTYYGAVVFTNTADNQQIQGRVYITVGTPTTAPVISGITYGSSALAAQKYGVFSVSATNQGTGISTPTFTLKITDQKGNLVDQTTITNQENTMPESTKTYTIAPSHIDTNTPLTASVTMVDQNGNTADKTIQLIIPGPAQPNSQPTTHANTPSSNTRLIIAGGLIAALLAAKLLKLRRYKNK